MRLTNNYLGRGLAGMQREAGIPECEDMYGVHKSGTPRALRRELDLSDHPRASHQNLVESGGIFILRPLLSYTKDRLIATCEEASVRWVEDHTNKDRSLTMRNTVRYLHEADRLPVALRRPNLGAIAARVFEQTTRLEIRVDELFRGFDVTFDPRSGHVVCRIPHKTANEINAMPDCDHVRAILLRKLLLLVAPAENMELSTLEAASSGFLRSNEGHDNASSKVITVAGAIAERLEDDTGTMVYELRRALPPRNAKGGRPEVRISLSSNTQQGLLTPVSWSDWYLWDERYWIRIGSCVHESLNVVVRLLTPADVAALRGKLQGTPREKYVELRLRKIKGHLRSTLPVLVQILPDKRERIVALPTLRWRRDEWFPADLENGHLTARLYEIRYKQIDKSLSEPIEAI
jgi:tRNA(Ile)-lysidine synthase